GVRGLHLEHVASAYHAASLVVPASALAFLEHGAVDVGESDRALGVNELLIDALDLHAAHLAVVACDDVFQSSPPVHALERGAVWLGRVAAGLLHPEL